MCGVLRACADSGAPESEAERREVAGQVSQAFIGDSVAPNEIEHAKRLGMPVVEMDECLVGDVLDVVLQAQRAQRERQRGQTLIVNVLAPPDIQLLHATRFLQHTTHTTHTRQ
jgi:hypothetical protein